MSGQSKSRLVKAAGAEEGAERRHQKLHAAVAKSTFWSENVQNTSAPKHFFFEVTMSQNCTPLWRKAHFKVKMLKNRRSGTTFRSSDAEKLYAAVAKCTFGSENVKKLSCSEHFLTFYCGKIAWHCGETRMCK